MIHFLIGFICGVSIGFVLCAWIVGGTEKEAPASKAGPRLPHHRIITMHKLPEWQEHQRDVDHLEAVSKSAREEAFWLRSEK